MHASRALPSAVHFCASCGRPSVAIVSGEVKGRPLLAICERRSGRPAVRRRHCQWRCAPAVPEATRPHAHLFRGRSVFPRQQVVEHDERLVHVNYVDVRRGCPFGGKGGRRRAGRRWQLNIVGGVARRRRHASRVGCQHSPGVGGARKEHVSGGGVRGSQPCQGENKDDVCCFC